MKKLLLFLLAIIIFFNVAQPVYAQFQSMTGCTDQGVATLRCIPTIFRNLVTALLMFVGATAVFLIIYSGIRFITSGGDPKKVEGARKIMTYAIIGVAIVLSSFFIIAFIGYLTRSSSVITDINCLETQSC